MKFRIVKKSAFIRKLLAAGELGDSWRSVETIGAEAIAS